MNKRIPSLNWLRVFEAAARTGSFARAAERLAMSPPAVSQQIRALEDHLGRPLFERKAAGVVLTESGRSLLVVVGESLGRMEAAAAVLSSPRAKPLVIGVSLLLSVGWLASRLPQFLEAHPGISLEVYSLSGRPETPPRMVEVWIAFGQPPPGTQATRLFGETLIPVAHPSVAESIQSVDDMLNHMLIEVSDHRKNWVQVLGADILPERARVSYVDTTLTALALAGAGGGVALARPPASDGLVEKFGLVRCLPDLEVAGVEDYHILSNTGARLSPDAQAFRDWVAGEAR